LHVRELADRYEIEVHPPLDRMERDPAPRS
jgi:hypothetical protein